MARGESTTSRRRLAAVERQERGLQLRAQGWTYRDIADALGWNSRKAAHKAVSLALARTTRRETPDFVEIWVALEQLTRYWCR